MSNLLCWINLCLFKLQFSPVHSCPPCHVCNRMGLSVLPCGVFLEVQGIVWLGHWDDAWRLYGDSQVPKMFSPRSPSWSLLPHTIIWACRSLLSLFSSPWSQHTSLIFWVSPAPLQLSCPMFLPALQSCPQPPCHGTSLGSMDVSGTDTDPELTISTGNNFNLCVWDSEKPPTTTQAAYYCTVLWATNQMHKEPSSTLSGLTRLFWQHLCHLKMGWGQSGEGSLLAEAVPAGVCSPGVDGWPQVILLLLSLPLSCF